MKKILIICFMLLFSMVLLSGCLNSDESKLQGTWGGETVFNKNFDDNKYLIDPTFNNGEVNFKLRKFSQIIEWNGTYELNSNKITIKHSSSLGYINVEMEYYFSGDDLILNGEKFVKK